MFQAFQVGNARSENRSLFRLSPASNPFLFTAAAAVAVHVAARYLPPTRHVLRVEPIGIDAWGRVVLVVASIPVAIKADKAVRRRKSRRSRPAAGPGEGGGTGVP